MVDSIFLLGTQEKLVELRAQDYDSEELLQRLLADHPHLIAGQQIDESSPRRWLFITREMGVPGEDAGSGRWSLDHLFLDQDGIPTLVEVKRSTDTRICREVVGQMLDYAANAVAYWPVEQIRAHFMARHANADNADRELLCFLAEDGVPEDFWNRVKTNLQAGKVRMIFVADAVPPELKRIVEFLNQQMDPAEVLALELRQYVGEGLKTLVPRVIGNTAVAGGKKDLGPAAKRQWNEQAFLQEVRSERGAKVTDTVAALLDWAKRNCDAIIWGKGGKWGSFAARVRGAKGVENTLFYLWMQSKNVFVELPLGYFTSDCPLSDLAVRQDFLGRVNRIPGVDLPADSTEKRRSFPLQALAEGTALGDFLAILDWAVGHIETERKELSSLAHAAPDAA
jgi:hypothetical protein